MINLGNERILFKKTGTGFFSIPSLTLSPSSASVQCAAVRTQDGWMRTPPHRNFPLLFCSIIWNKKREVWRCMEHSSQNIVHSHLCGCKMPRRIKHQSTSHSLKPKLYSGTKALWMEHLQKVLNILPEWGLASSKSQCWSLQRSTLVLQSFETQSSNEGIILVCTAHQRQYIISGSNFHATV